MKPTDPGARVAWKEFTDRCYTDLTRVHFGVSRHLLVVKTAEKFELAVCWADEGGHGKYRGMMFPSEDEARRFADRAFPDIPLCPILADWLHG